MGGGAQGRDEGGLHLSTHSSIFNPGPITDRPTYPVYSFPLCPLSGSSILSLPLSSCDLREKCLNLMLECVTRMSYLQWRGELGDFEAVGFLLYAIGCFRDFVAEPLGPPSPKAFDLSARHRTGQKQKQRRRGVERCDDVGSKSKEQRREELVNVMEKMEEQQLKGVFAELTVVCNSLHIPRPDAPRF